MSADVLDRSRHRRDLYALLVAARTQWAEMRWSPFVILLAAVQPTVLLVIVVHSGPRDVTGPAAGVILTSVWATTVWASASILRADRVYGTLAALLVAVVDARLVLIARVAAASALSVATSLGVVSVELVAAGAHAAVISPWGAVATGAVAWLSAVGLGMLLAALFVATRFAPLVSSAIMYPVFIVGGMLIPAAQLPAWARVLGWLVSFHWAQVELNATAIHGCWDGPAWIGLTLSTVGYFAVGLALFARVARRARADGSLDVS